jgi:hypothetical protein
MWCEYSLHTTSFIFREPLLVGTSRDPYRFIEELVPAWLGSVAVDCSVGTCGAIGYARRWTTPFYDLSTVLGCLDCWCGAVDAVVL